MFRIDRPFLLPFFFINEYRTMLHLKFLRSVSQLLTSRSFFTLTLINDNVNVIPSKTFNHNSHRVLSMLSFPSLTVKFRRFSTNHCNSIENQVNAYLETSDKNLFEVLSRDMKVIPDFLSEEDERSLLEEAEKSVKRLRYEFDHWDNAIHGYRETEKSSWNEKNLQIIQKVKLLAFDSQDSTLAFVHILDLAKDGYIKPHVDAVRFCGDTIAGMSLLSPCVMRLTMEKDSQLYGDVYLPRRSLYIMKDKARYDFTHEVLKNDESYFKGNHVSRDRRISIVCRNEPKPEDTL